MGQKVNPKSFPHSEKTRVAITGGKYAIFSVSRGKNYFDTANNVKKMVWHAYYSWKIFSEKEIDQNRIAFEMFDQEKAYYCVPLKAGYGGIGRKNDLSPYSK